MKPLKTENTKNQGKKRGGYAYLKSLNPAVCKKILEPFWKLETPMRKIPMERKSDT